MRRLAVGHFRCCVRVAFADPLEEVRGLDFNELPPFAVDPVDAKLNWQGVAVLLDAVSGEAIEGVELGDVEEQAIIGFAVLEVVGLGDVKLSPAVPGALLEVVTDLVGKVRRYIHPRHLVVVAEDLPGVGQKVEAAVVGVEVAPRRLIVLQQVGHPHHEVLEEGVVQGLPDVINVLVGLPLELVVDDLVDLQVVGPPRGLPQHGEAGVVVGRPDQRRDGVGVVDQLVHRVDDQVPAVLVLLEEIGFDLIE